jgi:undecaprenyl-diphosphatase
MNLLERLIDLDLRLSARLTMRQAGLSRAALHLVAHTGDSVLWVAISIGLALAGRSDLAGRGMLLVFGLALLVGVLKFAFQRSRPTGERGRLYFRMDAHSFPSGHAARTAGLALLLSRFEPTLGTAAIIWAAGVSLARVWLGVHYLSDVMAGALIGIMAGVIVVAL